MKKYLPFLLLLVGVLVLVGVYFKFFRKSTAMPSTVESESVPVVTLANRPVTSLTPSSDGHWLELNVKKIKITAASLDYELLYNLPDGRTQGVPGTVKLDGISEVQRDLLLGSESSGKYKYDEGVEKGTITLRFRDANGKLIAKFSTEFHLQTGTKQLTSTDGKFTYSLDKTSGFEFLVTMETFGYPGDSNSAVSSGPYGVFKAVAKVKTAHGPLPITSAIFPGTVGISGGSVYQANDSGWIKLSDNKSSDVGIFIGTQ